MRPTIWALLGLSLGTGAVARAEAEPAAAAPAGKTWTLPALMEWASAHSPDVADARLRAREAEADATTAALRLNPVGSLGLSNVSLGPTTPGTTWAGSLIPSVGVSQELELFGQRGHRMAAAQHAVEAGGLQARDAARLARFDIQAAYYRALAAQAHLRVSEESLSRYEAAVKTLRLRVAAGDAATADLNKLELEMFRYQSELESSRFAAMQARADLFSKLALPADAAADRVDGDLAAPVQVASGATDIDARPDVAALSKAVEKAGADVALAQANGRPNLTVGLGYSHQSAELGGGAVNALGLTASMPLPFFSRNQGEVAKASLEQERARIALERARRDAAREATLAREHLRSSDALVQRLEQDALRRADHAQQLAEKSYLGRQGPAAGRAGGPAHRPGHPWKLRRRAPRAPPGRARARARHGPGGPAMNRTHRIAAALAALSLLACEKPHAAGRARGARRARAAHHPLAARQLRQGRADSQRARHRAVGGHGQGGLQRGRDQPHRLAGLGQGAAAPRAAGRQGEEGPAADHAGEPRGRGGARRGHLGHE